MTLEKITELERLSTRFRVLINLPRRNHDLRHGKDNFYQVCSAMDIIGDVSMALRSYLKNERIDLGLAYLEIFGVLNALYIQQDAMRKLHSIILASEIDLEKDYPKIKEIRNARIHVAGHPVTGAGKSHFLSQFSLTHEGFKYLSFSDSGEMTESEVNIYEYISYQLDALEEVTQKLNTYMEEEDKKHKELFMDISLTEIFNGYGYLSGKLFEDRESYGSINAINVESICTMLEKFEASLQERSAHFTKSDFFSYDIQKLKYALSKYQQYLNYDSSVTKDDAYIIVYFIQMELDSIFNIAKEIDEEYSS